VLPAVTRDDIAPMHPRDLLGAEMLFDAIYTAAE
jgi:hypothetical protein